VHNPQMEAYDDVVYACTKCRDALKSTLPFAVTRNWFRSNQEILKDKIFVNRLLGENGKS